MYDCDGEAQYVKLALRHIRPDEIKKNEKINKECFNVVTCNYH